MRGHVALISIVAAIGAAAAPSIAAVAPAPRAFDDAVTVMSVDRAAGGPVQLAFPRDSPDSAGPIRVVERTLDFTLPAGAEQGGDEGWYVLDVRAEIRFGAGSSAGFAWLSAATNDRTAVQLEYELKEGSTPASVGESAVGLIDKSQRRSLTLVGGRVRHRNFLQLNGIRAGRNRVTFRLEETAGLHVEAVQILPTTRVFRTRHSPYPLRLSVSGPARVAAGTDFAVTAVVRSELRESVEDVKVGLEFDPTHFRLIGQQEASLGTVGGRRPKSARFVFRPLQSGRGEITILATSRRNRPHRTISVAVGTAPPAAAGTSDGWILSLAAIGLGLVAIGVVVVLTGGRRRGRRGSAPADVRLDSSSGGRR